MSTNNSTNARSPLRKAVKGKETPARGNRGGQPASRSGRSSGHSMSAKSK